MKQKQNYNYDLDKLLKKYFTQRKAFNNLNPNFEHNIFKLAKDQSNITNKKLGLFYNLSNMKVYSFPSLTLVATLIFTISIFFYIQHINTEYDEINQLTSSKDQSLNDSSKTIATPPHSEDVMTYLLNNPIYIAPVLPEYFPHPLNKNQQEIIKPVKQSSDVGIRVYEAEILPPNTDVKEEKFRKNLRESY